MESSSGKAAALDATANTGPPADPDMVQQLRNLEAAEAERRVEKLEAKAEALKDALKEARAEAKRLRQVADKGGDE